MHAPLYPYQEKLVDAMTSSPALFVAADMGLGKTRCAIEAAQCVGAQRVLVLAPAIGRVVWPAEVAKWITHKRVDVLSVTDPLQLAGATLPMTFKVVSYGSVSRDPNAWAAAARLWNPEVVVIDEAHYLARTGAISGRRTARTTAIYGRACDRRGSMIENASYVWPMSGTPVVGHTADLWTHLRALAPQTILSPAHGRPMSELEFQDRYSTTHVSAYGRHVTGSVNTARLREATQGFFYRLRKADVLPDLPPITWADTPLDPVLVADTARTTFDVPEDVPADDLLDWLEAHAEHIATQRRMLGLAKVGAATEALGEFLRGCDRKLIVFGHHPEVLELLGGAPALAEYQPVLITGQTPTLVRLRAVEQFQNDERCRLFLGQTHACGTALTLTAASDVMFVEPDWSPAVMAQAAHRALRIGQSRGVLVRVLYVPGSIDEAIARVAARKASEIDKLFKHHEE